MDQKSFATYRGPSDLDRISRAVSSSWRTLGAGSQVHLGNLAWRLASQDLARPSDDLGIWLEKSAEVAAFATIYEAFPLDLFIHPADRHHEGLLREMLDWTEARWRAVHAAAGPDRPLRIGCLARDKLRIGLLRTRGYQDGDKTYLRLTCPLEGPLKLARLSREMAVRPLRLPEDIDRLVGLHNEVFPAPQIDDRRLKQIGHTPWRTTGFIRVVESEQHEIVAFAFGWLDPQSRSLEFEPVGCHPEWRRRGLAGGLLRDIMNRAYRAGARVASVTAPGGNPQTIAFYHAMGFNDYETEFEFVLT